MTIVLNSCKSFVIFRSIALKMGVLDVKNVQNSGFLEIISVRDIFRIRVTKKPKAFSFFDIFG